MRGGRSEIRLVLFFTRGVSLRAWDQGGMLAREVALYRRLQEHAVHVTFVTYGDEDDLHYASRIPGISICCNQSGAELPKDGELPTWLDAHAMQRADLVKTNQTNGSLTALAAARQWGKPLVARCGYMWSLNAARRHGDDSPLARECRRIEETVFTAADQVVVTTEAMKADVFARLPGVGDRVRVIPNYVDTELFSPAAAREHRPPRLAFVGRWEAEKNLASLAAAVRDLNVELIIIGSGPMRRELVVEGGRNPRLFLIGRVPSEELPHCLRRCSAFVLPSLYEGHPKALIEAMACGLPVIGSDVPGIRDVIHHGVTGWLCGTSADSLRAAIRTVLGDPRLAERLGRNARRFVLEHYALRHIVEQELLLYREVLGVPIGV